MTDMTNYHIADHDKYRQSQRARVVMQNMDALRAKINELWTLVDSGQLPEVTYFRVRESVETQLQIYQLEFDALVNGVNAFDGGDTQPVEPIGDES